MPRRCWWWREITFRSVNLTAIISMSWSQLKINLWFPFQFTCLLHKSNCVEFFNGISRTTLIEHNVKVNNTNAWNFVDNKNTSKYSLIPRKLIEILKNWHIRSIQNWGIKLFSNTKEWKNSFHLIIEIEPHEIKKCLQPWSY